MPEIRIVDEHAVEVGGVVGAVALDHGRRLHQGDEVEVRLGGIEPVPRNVLDTPMLHRGVRTVRSRVAKLPWIGWIRKGGGNVIGSGQIALPEPLLIVEILSPSNEAATWENVWAYVS